MLHPFHVPCQAKNGVAFNARKGEISIPSGIVQTHIRAESSLYPPTRVRALSVCIASVEGAGNSERKGGGGGEKGAFTLGVPSLLQKHCKSVYAYRKGTLFSARVLDKVFTSWAALLLLSSL